jgi:hypothetical protein
VIIRFLIIDDYRKSLWQGVILPTGLISEHLIIRFETSVNTLIFYPGCIPSLGT